ncbi:hypothetical protein JAAARDRAFT_126972 [Jaapia argillacea MUCL 33604]|uniref:PPM-type phosphatase domain-containing protein n=1 Tax=Jaapia argillacea MUCL 33604 TaxID=933084 RepID=A0A067PZ22_9AGAM|nr:hypothetical protein JAAARDRAFT_126972 [Jaapia argillacea MUCL 33604]
MTSSRLRGKSLFIIFSLDTVLKSNSNDPTEDDHAEAILPNPNGVWGFFSVLDGHSGWETSTWLRENLIPALSGSLADLYSKYRSNEPTLPFSSPDPPPNEVDDTIKRTFQRLDDKIVHEAIEKVFSSPSRHAATNLLAPAYSGSCALVAFYESPTRLLRIALTGDSRAVLGRRKHSSDGGHVYEVHVLSTDQNGYNLSEQTRLRSEHPDEDVVKNGRVMGMGMARAFGDARWKWTPEVQKRLKFEYLGRSLPPGVKTPPYLTAVPEVTTFKVMTGDFLILATDGLWECLTNEEAVGLTGLWLDRNSQKANENPLPPVVPKDLPVVKSGEDTTVRYRQWAATKRFVNLDSNAATHLARNALGGADTDLASALFSLRAPRSRTYMDDITAIIIFFGEASVDTVAGEDNKGDP